MRKLEISKMLLIMLMFIIPIVGCNDETVIDSNKKDRELVGRINYPTNPFDNIGIEHNVIMSYLLNRVDEGLELENYYTNQLEAKEQIAKIMFDGYQSTGYNLSKTFEEIQTEVNNTDLEIIAGTSPENYFERSLHEKVELYMNSKLIPNSTVNDSIYLCRIRDLISDEYKELFENISLEKFENADPNTFIQKVKELEEEMLSYTWDTDDYKALKMISLLKYTSEMWTQKIFGEVSASGKLSSNGNYHNSKEDQYLEMSKEEKRAKLVSIMRLWGKWAGAVFADGGAGIPGSSLYLTLYEAAEDSGLLDKYYWYVANQIIK